MTTNEETIERLSLPPSDADVRGLARLLVDAVDSGAAVSFVAPLALGDAEAWWRRTLATAPSRWICLVARSGREGDPALRPIIGTVQLHPAWAPNQPHRAEVVKLLVGRANRRAGLGRRLMEAIERAGRDSGFTLLTLDAKGGGVAEGLYRRLGWSFVGTIPRYALDTDGTTLHDGVFFFKALTIDGCGSAAQA